jgi:hypothetical protein
MVGNMTRDCPLKPGISISTAHLATAMLRFHTFGPPINQRFEAFLVIFINHANERRVDPSSSLNTVQTADDHLELHIEGLIEVLDFAVVRRDLHPLDPLLYEPCCYLGLGFSNIAVSE